MIQAFIEPRNQDIADEVTLKTTFEDLVAHGCTWEEFFSLLDAKHVWTASDCCVLRQTSEGPSDHQYTLEISCEAFSAHHEIKITGPDSESTASTLNGLFLLFSTSDSDLELTFKSFATQPRQPFPILTDTGSEALLSSKVFKCIRLHFVSLNEGTCRLFLSASVPQMEFRQCTVSGMAEALQLDQCPEKLTVSCSMAEFAGLAHGLGGNTSLKELELLLHFWLQGEPFLVFTKALKGNLGLRHLKLSYLDLGDDSWSLLFKALHQHPTLKSLHLKFTDNFVDNYRRLTSERRQTRTQAVLEMVRVNTIIEEITWPEFQQDTELMDEINTHLARNRNAAYF
jgi:hypothetical protein